MAGRPNTVKALINCERLFHNLCVEGFKSSILKEFGEVESALDKYEKKNKTRLKTRYFYDDDYPHTPIY